MHPVNQDCDVSREQDPGWYALRPCCSPKERWGRKQSLQGKKRLCHWSASSSPACAKERKGGRASVLETDGGWGRIVRVESERLQERGRDARLY